MRRYFPGQGDCLLKATSFFLFVCLTSFHFPIDRLILHIGKPYVELVEDSTFPVKRQTAVYPSDPPEVDPTWKSSPVVITFDDHEHGFTLPETIYGAVGYSKGKVDGISTSPMVETPPFPPNSKTLGRSAIHVQKDRLDT
jgi:hypothetical protein